MPTDDSTAWMKNAPEHSPPLDLDTGKPHSARIWNYWLSGKDNFEPDRAVGEMVKQTFPDIVTTARQVRAEWRPDPDTGQPPRVDAYGGVARKP